jgi:hypothetical protein
MSYEQVCCRFKDSTEIQTKLRRQEVDGFVLNTATEEDLVKTVGLSNMQAKAVLRMRDAIQRREMGLEDEPAIQVSKPFLMVRTYFV